jgi:hypothetical protein
MAGIACAQETKFVETGTWKCTLAGDPPLCEQKIPFTPHFGSLPEVTVSLNFIPTSVGLNITQKPGYSPSLRADVIKSSATEFTVRASIDGATGSTEVAGSWVAVGYLTQNVTAKPKFLVVSVIYAPPGANGGNGPSTVTYQSGSTSGFKLSTTDTFNQDYLVSAATEGGLFGGWKGGPELSLGYSKSTSDGKSLEVQESFTQGTQYPGPKEDGINHDFDQILVWVNPEVGLALTPADGTWTLKTTEKSRVMALYVGWLNHNFPESQWTEEKVILEKYGIKDDDYPDILGRDPLAQNTSDINLPRYVPLKTVPYAPPAKSGAGVNIQNLILTSSSTSTATQTAKDTYTVGLTFTAKEDGKVAQNTLKNVNKWTWTHEVSRATSTGSSSSAIANFGGPAKSMPAGQHFITVYLDSLYRTFAFAFVADQPVALHGTVVGADGKPKANIEVTLFENPTQYPTFITLGTPHRTVTNAKGEYTFFGNINGPATLQIGSVTRAVNLPEKSVALLQLK